MKKKDYIFYKKRYWQYILICDEDGYRPSEYPSFQCYVKGIETLLNLLKLKQFLVYPCLFRLFFYVLKKNEKYKNNVAKISKRF